jgi:hypothetical protein
MHERETHLVSVGDVARGCSAVHPKELPAIRSLSRLTAAVRGVTLPQAVGISDR